MDQLNQILNSLLSLLSSTNGSQISNNSTTSTGTDESSTALASGQSINTINNFLQEQEMNDDHQSTSKRDTNEKKQHVQQTLQKTASTDPGFNANQFLYKKHRNPDNSEE